MDTVNPSYEALRERVAQLESQFSEQKLLFGALAENSRDIILFVRQHDGRIVEANAAASAYGYSREELLALTICDLRTPESLDQVQEQMNRADISGALFETVHRRRDGTVFPVEVSSVGATIHGTRVLLSLVRDITPRKKAEEILSVLKKSVDVSADAAFWADSEGRFIYVNDSACKSLGYDRDRLMKMHIYDASPDAGIERWRDIWRQIQEKGTLRFESTHRRKDGSEFPVEVVSTFVRLGERKYVCGFARDITERKRTEEALRASEERFRRMFQHSAVGMVLVSPDFYFLNVNSKFCSMLGYTEAELLEKTFQDVTHEEDRPVSSEQVRRVLSGEMEAFQFEKRYLRKDGTVVWGLVSSTLIRDRQNAPLHFVTQIMDITERKQAEDALRISEEGFRKIFEESPIGIAFLDAKREIIHTNQRFRDFVGYDETEIIERGPVGLLHPDDWGASIEMSEKLRAGAIPLFHMEQRYIRKDGTVVRADTHITVLRDNYGRLIHTIAWIQDVTERKRAEDARRESEHRLRTLADNLPAAVLYQLVVDAGGHRQFTYISDAVCRVNEVSVEAVLADANVLLSQMLPEYLPGLRAAEDKAIRVGRNFQYEFQALLPSGRTRWFELSAVIHMLPDGRAMGEGVQVDITERKQAEEDKAKLQAQCQQAQKMETVGRLAGGVAHDFNNMLGVILGHAEMALGEIDPSHPLHYCLQEIREAAKRSADLTRQLLALARKQTVAPRVLDLNETIAGMLNILHRLIGEDIRLDWHPSAELWPVKVDPSQIDQIVVNLCVNSRDAITGVGNVAIETGNSTLDQEYCAAHPGFVPGDYVYLAVGDDGCGMDEGTLARIFEPFFTTKETGKGTGLGLATVYGSVKQNNGFITVDSKPGQGTTFRIYLPRHVSGTRRAARTKGTAEPAVCGRETILLVEDEPAILRLTKVMLEKQGYTVLAASTPAEALRMARELGGHIHLLMTDVIMPEMNGRDLARNLLSLYPNIKCLFTSGYTANVIAHHGVLDEGIHFIQKPFSAQDLAVKLREALNSDLR
jgi:two-component system, cell cycle sensor histidine kinase and response regulator CckA